MASPYRPRVVKALVPGKLTERSKNFSMVLCVEKAPERREFEHKEKCEMHNYGVIVGIGEDGLRQDCVFFGEAFEKMPVIEPGACFGPH